MNGSAAILPILLLAFLCEGLVEYLGKPLFRLSRAAESGAEQGEAPDSAKPSGAGPMALRYLAALVGVALAFAYRADILAMAGLTPALPWIGYLITGLIIGRGSNYINDLADRWL